MSTGSLRLLGLLVCTLVVSAFVENCAIAQGQVDDGTVTAIEIYRASDNQPINAGTVLGGIAGGVIGHQIGSGRGNTAATIIPGITNRTAWLTGTVHGKSLALRKEPSGFKQNLLKTITPRSR